MSSPYIIGHGFNMENNLLFCVDCYSSLYGATCFGCSQRIKGDELWVEALEHQWHPSCFVCDVREGGKDEGEGGREG